MNTSNPADVLTCTDFYCGLASFLLVAGPYVAGLVYFLFRAEEERETRPWMCFWLYAFMGMAFTITGARSLYLLLAAFIR